MTATPIRRHSCGTTCGVPGRPPLSSCCLLVATIMLVLRATTTPTGSEHQRFCRWAMATGAKRACHELLSMAVGETKCQDKDSRGASVPNCRRVFVLNESHFLYSNDRSSMHRRQLLLVASVKRNSGQVRKSAVHIAVVDMPRASFGNILLKKSLSHSLVLLLTIFPTYFFFTAPFFGSSTLLSFLFALSFFSKPWRPSVDVTWPYRTGKSRPQ
jgi:hypothetical protein